VNADCKPPSLDPDTEFLLAALRCASRRLKLIDEEVILIGLALQKGLISPQEAVARTEDIAPGCLDAVATSMRVTA
jgi:hypothetical protein